MAPYGRKRLAPYARKRVAPYPRKRLAPYADNDWTTIGRELTACMRKLLIILNAMVRTGTPWSPLQTA